MYWSFEDEEALYLVTVRLSLPSTTISLTIATIGLVRRAGSVHLGSVKGTVIDTGSPLMCG